MVIYVTRIIVSRLTHLLTINIRKAVLIYRTNILIKGQSFDREIRPKTSVILLGRVG